MGKIVCCSRWVSEGAVMTMPDVLLVQSFKSIKSFGVHFI